MLISYEHLIRLQTLILPLLLIRNDGVHSVNETGPPCSKIDLEDFLRPLDAVVNLRRGRSLCRRFREPVLQLRPHFSYIFDRLFGAEPLLAAQDEPLPTNLRSRRKLEAAHSRNSDIPNIDKTTAPCERCVRLEKSIDRPVGAHCINLGVRNVELGSEGSDIERWID